MPTPAKRRIIRGKNHSVGPKRSAGSAGVKQRAQQRLRTVRRRAGRSS